jgi:hypothetical protein
MNSPRKDVEDLLDFLLRVVRRWLQQHREFFPVVAHKSAAGELKLDAASDGTEQPSSQALIDILRDAYKKPASAGAISACAIFL